MNKINLILQRENSKLFFQYKIINDALNKIKIQNNSVNCNLIIGTKAQQGNKVVRYQGSIISSHKSQQKSTLNFTHVSVSTLLDLYQVGTNHQLSQCQKYNRKLTRAYVSFSKLLLVCLYRLEEVINIISYNK
ncbi:Hypothetical_protein [Hexamita inflata]|uniref:Hypothetical_protein n=1 Tax=Hexamita inflata TaxID=28002 RepID=A0AA86TGK5_9EUKA|nr:Hypothetical protein HINF_LOCUS3741 [Hexamita inflata]CAI9916945.1 Hypothetical protein HINF_LOCUS4590 [Hexamita inflata]